MKLGMKFREQLNKLPALVNELDSAYAAIRAGFGAQHNDDDTHGTVTASGSISERGRTVAMGEWITPAFNQADYYVGTPGHGSVGSWTSIQGAGIQILPVLSYTLVGKTMLLNVYVDGSSLTLSGTIGYVTVKIPDNYVVAVKSIGGFSIGSWYIGMCQLIDGAGSTVGRIQARAGNNYVLIDRADGANLTAYFQFTIIGQVQFEVL